MIHPAGAISTQPIDRRDFMKAAGAAFAATLAPQRLFAVEQAEAVFATAYQIKDGPCGVAVLSEDCKLLFTSPLPDRGHDVTYDPIARRSVVFARRPGTFAVVFDHTGAIRADDHHQPARPALLRPWRVLAGRQAALCHRERFRERRRHDRHLRRDRRIRPHRRISHARHGRARNAAARRRPHAGDRQWRHRNASGLRPRQAQHRDHEAVIRVHRPAERQPDREARAGAGTAPAVDPPHGRGRLRHAVVQRPVRRPRNRPAAADRQGAQGRGAAARRHGRQGARGVQQLHRSDRRQPRRRNRRGILAARQRAGGARRGDRQGRLVPDDGGSLRPGARPRRLHGDDRPRRGGRRRRQGHALRRLFLGQPCS